MDSKLMIPAQELRDLIRKTTPFIDKKTSDRPFVKRIKFFYEKPFLCAIATNGLVIPCAKTEKFMEVISRPFVIDYEFADKLLVQLENCEKASVTISDKSVSVAIDGKPGTAGKNYEEIETYPDWEAVFTPVDKLEHIFSVEAKDLWSVVSAERDIPKATLSHSKAIRGDRWIRRCDIIGDMEVGGVDFIVFAELLAALCSPAKGIYKEGLLYFYTANEGDRHPQQKDKDADGNEAPLIDASVPIAVCHSSDPNTYYIIMNQIRSNTEDRIAQFSDKKRKPKNG